MTEFKKKTSAAKIWKLILDKKAEIKSDNNTIVLFICLVVSTLFWFLKALNDDYRTEVSFPIEFTNIPDNYSLYGELPTELVATIEDDGFTIMRYKFSFVFSSLKFDVSKHFSKMKNVLPDDGTLEISQAALSKGIANALISKSNLISIYPETVDISYSKLKEKKIPIKVLAEITTENQYIVSGSIKTIPDSVLVMGSGIQLENTQAILTQPVRAQNLEDSIIRNIALQPVKGLILHQKKVQLIIPVESYTEKIIEVPIVGRHFPDSLDIRTFPGVATVSCICGLSVYNKIYPSDFSCYINYDLVRDKSNGHIEVQINSTNKLAQRVLLRSKSVDYLIEKRN